MHGMEEIGNDLGFFPGIDGVLGIVSTIIGGKNADKDRKAQQKMLKTQQQMQSEALAIQTVSESQKRAMTGAMVIGGGVLLIAGILVYGAVRGKGKS